MAKSEIGVFIQARTGSGRLPGKVVKPFYVNQTILEILIQKLKTLELPILVATTLDSTDDVIVDIAHDCNVRTFRGSEHDVLQRFIDGAEKYNVDTIVRVCADNPFLDITGTMALIDQWRMKSFDYVSYRMKNGLPAIKSHLGFWAEVVTLSALKRIAEQTDAALYHEHVTNYIYENEHEFNLRFLPAPAIVTERTDIRMTVDTPADFELSKHIYSELVDMDDSFDLATIVAYLDRHQQYLEVMNEQIELNSK